MVRYGLRCKVANCIRASKARWILGDAVSFIYTGRYKAQRPLRALEEQIARGCQGRSDRLILPEQDRSVVGTSRLAEFSWESAPFIRVGRRLVARLRHA